MCPHSEAPGDRTRPPRWQKGREGEGAGAGGSGVRAARPGAGGMLRNGDAWFSCTCTRVNLNVTRLLCAALRSGGSEWLSEVLYPQFQLLTKFCTSVFAPSAAVSSPQSLSLCFRSAVMLQALHPEVDSATKVIVSS